VVALEELVQELPIPAESLQGATNLRTLWIDSARGTRPAQDEVNRGGEKRDKNIFF